MSRNLKQALAEDCAAVEEKLLSLYPQSGDTDVALLYDAQKYSLMAGGKRIRPFIVMEVCRALGGDMNAALQFGAAIEQLHTFSLIHDDMPCMDNDDFRRGRPTSHKVYGEAVALQTGDAMCIKAFQTVLECPDVPAETAREAAYELAVSSGSLGMVGGQVTDMRGEREQFDFDTLLKLHSMKTGALIRLSAKLGCIAAGIGREDERYKACVEYASGIGLAFQIVDDILDATSDAQTLGKSVGSDRESGKTTFLSFMGIDEARAYATLVTDKAKAAIAGMEGFEILLELADFLLTRNK